MGPGLGYAHTVRADRQPGGGHRHHTAQKASKIIQKNDDIFPRILKIINVYNVTVAKKRRKRKRKWEPDGQPVPLARGRQQARSASGTRRSRRKRKGNGRQRRQLMSSLLEVCRLWLVLVRRCRRNRGTVFLLIILEHLLFSILFRSIFSPRFARRNNLSFPWHLGKLIMYGISQQATKHENIWAYKMFNSCYFF
jgi:hypothetical protein